MPILSAMLASAASATEAHAPWVALAGTPAGRRRLAEADRPLDPAEHEPA
jgi:hypothetical protein